MSSFWQGEDGQWWYRTSGKDHRAKEMECSGCKKTFIGRRTVKRPNVYCSRDCFWDHQPITDREGNPRWKGGKWVDKDGYVKLWMGRGNPKLFEHRKVMSDYLGRKLRKGETVHHINGNRQDNRLENLQLRIKNHGPGQHYVCMDCGSDKLEAKEIG